MLHVMIILFGRHEITNVSSQNLYSLIHSKQLVLNLTQLHKGGDENLRMFILALM